ncbi:MAG: imidazoleglycerol-phosphate dehydratase HisB [SAR202 cluster bacterium]|nr:imidazoleglycerol-phosphate dehydratase HisB [SAR202 cluster bacterium]
MTKSRKSSVHRKTQETDILVDLNLDGTGKHQIKSGNGTLDHLLVQLSRHGSLDLAITAKGDLETGWHHTVEDIAIALGRAIHEAVGDGRGITRIAHSFVPFDETLAQVILDLSGRGYALVDTQLNHELVEHLPGDMVRHFLETLAIEGKFTLHARVVYGQNSHHKAEGLFKALARALAEASRISPRTPDQVPSSKGTLR